MFIGTQCDLWGKPDGKGYEKISRENFPRLIFCWFRKLLAMPLVVPYTLEVNRISLWRDQPHG